MTKDEALEFVRQYFERHGDIKSDGRDISAHVMMMQSGVTFEIEGPIPPTFAEAMALGDDGPMLRAKYTAEKIEPLLKMAEADRLAHKAACEVAAGLLNQGAPLPPDLAKFAADALRGSNVPKGKRGTDKREDLLRNRRIIQVVCLLQEREILPTRNNATMPGNYGCDIVAEVLNLSYDAIAKIWKSRPK